MEAAKRLVLLVETDTLLALEIKAGLDQAGYDVVTAHTYETAMRAAAMHQPDLALVDPTIGGVTDGIDTAIDLYRRFSVPIVFLSALADMTAEGIMRAKLAQPRGYMSKPVVSVTLLTSVALTLSRFDKESPIRELSLLDGLTGIYNRRGLVLLGERQLQLAARTKHSVLTVFADVDDLRSVNETVGHAAGDLAIKATAAALLGTFRDSDVIARIGGDEFVVLALLDDKGNAAKILERLDQHIAEIDVGVSVGSVVHDPQLTTSLSELISKADELMYRSRMKKQLGRET